METVNEIVGVLNNLLNSEVMDDQLLERSVNQYNELCESKTAINDCLTSSLDNTYKPGIGLMDFVLYTEEKREEVRLLKLKKIKEQNFEHAANLGDLEKECITYLEFKKHHGFEKSTFVIIQGFLIYAYFGTAANDQLIRGILEKGKRLKSMKIR